MGTAVTTPTPVQRPPEKPVQRSARTSAVGHGIGLGGNAALYAFGTYGWGMAATIGGLLLAGAGIRRLRGRRNSSRGGLFGGGRGALGGGRRGVLGRLFGGRGRGGGLGGSGRGSKRGGLFGSGGRGSGASKKGGFLRRLASSRSSTPRSGGGIPGRGKGGNGRGLLGGGRAGRGGLLGRRSGVAAGGKGPGSRRGGGGLLGGSGGAKGRGGSGRGGGLFGGKGGGGSGGGRGRSAVGRGIGRLLGALNPFRNHDPDRKPKDHQSGTPSGWEEALPNPDRTKWKEITMTGSAPRKPVLRPQASRGNGGGSLTAAAEQLAGTLGKPGADVNTLRKLGRDLGDLAGVASTLQAGFRQHAKLIEEGMPDEKATHEELGRSVQMLGQLAAQFEMLQADHYRRNSSDYQRLDNHRIKEENYDATTNNNE